MTNKAHDFYTLETITAMENDRQNAITSSRMTFDAAWDYTHELIHIDALIMNERINKCIAQGIQEALERHYGPTRMPEFMARIDYQEMINFRKLPPVPAHIFCLAEIELRTR